MPYWGWLAVISAGVAGLEAVWPWRPNQAKLRERLPSDLCHLVFNGHFLGSWIYIVAVTWIEPALRGALGDAGRFVWVGIASSWPFWLQCVVVTVAMDFVQWCVHNLLHRVPWLWAFHKVHHSVKDGEMDWIVSFRFHWMEVVLYKGFQYLPLAFFGFDGGAILFHAVFGTLIGHLNHANLAWDYGPLRYVLNNPKMHIWHHDYDAKPGETRNFGIIFSCWDYLFGTARVPAEPPRAVGFPGVEDFPRTFLMQELVPLVPGSGGRG
jgi:sterol desaturase/sphingolipid hydroxylase (fatty acid hydroxylase superfamily)